MKVKARLERERALILNRINRGSALRGDTTAVRRLSKDLKEIDRKFKQHYFPRLEAEKHDLMLDRIFRSFFTDQAFKEKFVIEGKKHKRGSLAMLDIDFLKRINDGYGHLTGDAVLMQFANVFKEVLGKEGGFIGRHRGDELVVYAPVSTERLVSLLRKADLRMKETFANALKKIYAGIGSKPEKVLGEMATMSAGVMPVQNAELWRKELRYYGELMEKADKLTYKSKKNRNSVTVDGEKPRVIRHNSRFVEHVTTAEERKRKNMQKMR